MRPAQSASLRAVLHRGIGRHRRLSFEAPGKGKTTRAPRRAYATQNPHRNAAACKTRSPVRMPPKSAQKRRCMQNAVARAYATRNPHRNAAACKTRSPARATALRQKAQKLRQTETPAQARNRRRVSVSGGLRSAALFARAFRCADKSAPGMPRPCSPLRRFRLRVHCRT